MIELCKIVAKLFQSLREEILVFFTWLNNKSVSKVKNVQMRVFVQSLFYEVGHSFEIRQKLGVGVIYSDFLPYQ